MFKSTVEETSDVTKILPETTINNEEGKVNTEQNGVFCCKQTLFYKPRRTEHEDLFNSFLKFAQDGQSPKSTKDDQRALQVVKQKNFSKTIEEKRYFCLPDFHEVNENEFNNMGYKRLNSFKNLRCDKHNYFFEMNAYKKGIAYSNHHKSTVHGNIYLRNSSEIDQTPGDDKGIWDRSSQYQW